MSEMIENIMWLDELNYRLQSHDWYYQYSDDHRVWKQGNTAQKEINELLKQLVRNGCANRAEEVWNEYAPESVPFPIDKNK